MKAPLVAALVFMAPLGGCMALDSCDFLEADWTTPGARAGAEALLATGREGVSLAQGNADRRLPLDDPAFDAAWPGALVETLVRVGPDAQARLASQVEYVTLVADPGSVGVALAEDLLRRTTRLDEEAVTRLARAAATEGPVRVEGPFLVMEALARAQGASVEHERFAVTFADRAEGWIVEVRPPVVRILQDGDEPWEGLYVHPHDRLVLVEQEGPRRGGVARAAVGALEAASLPGGVRDLTVSQCLPVSSA